MKIKDMSVKKRTWLAVGIIAGMVVFAIGAALIINAISGPASGGGFVGKNPFIK